MAVRGHRVAFDWSQGGSYSGPVEDVSSYVNDGTIEVSWGRNVDGTLSLASTSGQMTVSLNNESQVFSPENSTSPIFGKILPGRSAQYQVTNSSVTYTLLEGTLDEYEVDGDPVTTFDATVLDAWGRPGAETLSTALYTGIRTGAAIGVVLDAIGWTGGREIDPGATYMPFWWEEGTDATTAITKLVHSEGTPAIAYVRGGTFVFRDRHHRLLDTRSQNSQGLFTHISPQGTGPGGDFKILSGTFRYNHGVKRICNNALFSVPIRRPTDYGEVWASEDPVTIASGATATLIVQTDDPFMNATPPSVGVGDIQVLTGTVSNVTLSRTSGQSTIISITVSADTVLSRIAMRANSVVVAQTVQVSAQDLGSIGNFKQRSWPTEAAPVWANQYDAQVIATKVVAVYGSYRPTITFTIAGINAATLTEILTTRISDRITVRNDIRKINADFMVERLTHRIVDFDIHYLDVTCEAAEPTQPANVFTFGVAGKGFNDGKFGIDGIDDPAGMFVFDVAGKGFNDGRFAN